MMLVQANDTCACMCVRVRACVYVCFVTALGYDARTGYRYDVTWFSRGRWCRRSRGVLHFDHEVRHPRETASPVCVCVCARARAC